MPAWFWPVLTGSDWFCFTSLFKLFFFFDQIRLPEHKQEINSLSYFLSI